MNCIITYKTILEKKKINTYIRFVFILVIIVGFNQKSFAAEPHQLRTSINLQKDFEKLKLTLNNANFFDLKGNWFLYHAELLIDFKSEKSISFGLGYKQEYVKLPDRIRVEYRPKLNMYYNTKWGFVKFRDRNRLEARFIDGENINRYRNQLLFSYDKFTKVKPYFLTEFWFRIKDMEYFRQESVIGLQFPFKVCDISFFYQQWFNKYAPNKWEYVHMPGTSLTFKF